MRFPDTIFALSSGPLPSGVALIRISGSEVRVLCSRLVGRQLPPRVASLCRMSDSQGQLLDQGLCVFFPAPASFTGEDCLELNVHGGRAVVSNILAELASHAGMRMAEPGEFTRRAFLNGKMDLAAAEALGDLVAAETADQRKFALQAAGGVQSRLYEAWRRRIIHAMAMISADLDFADESDIPGSVAAVVRSDIAALFGEIGEHIDGYRRAEIVREGYSVAIVGPPNAGKSSLLNALAKRDVAIVSDEPGTTRDILEIALDLDGAKVIIADTAGLRENPGTIEGLGIERALRRAREADLVLELVPPGARSLGLDVCADTRLVVASKIDLEVAVPGSLGVSTVTGHGVEALLRELGGRAKTSGAAQGLLPARQRHVHHLRATANCLARALHVDDLELQAEELRLASRSLGAISGQVDVEDVLDVIFSTFCIGK